MQVNSVTPSPNFQAVNQKYVQRAQSEYSKIKCISTDLTFCLQTDVICKKLSNQDAIDTLTAIKQFAKRCVADLDDEIEFYTKRLREQV